MIPPVEEIVRMLAAGSCTEEQALAWIALHEAREDDRRMFAAMAMQGMLANEPAGCAYKSDPTANRAVMFADALVSALRKPRA